MIHSCIQIFLATIKVECKMSLNLLSPNVTFTYYSYFSLCQKHLIARQFSWDALLSCDLSCTGATKQILFRTYYHKYNEEHLTYHTNAQRIIFRRREGDMTNTACDCETWSCLSSDCPLHSNGFWGTFKSLQHHQAWNVGWAKTVLANHVQEKMKMERRCFSHRCVNLSSKLHLLDGRS